MNHFIFLLTILISMPCVNGCMFLNNNRIKKYNIEKIQLNNRVSHMGSFFYKGDKQYHESVEELYELNKQDNSYFDWLNKLMIDPYAKEGQIIKYIPIYDDTSTHVIACIFLSVGEDGIFNNNITQKLHMDNWHKVIKAYNLDEVKEEIEKFSLRYPMFNRKNNHQGWRIIDVDESVLSNKNIVLRGDSLFRDNFNFDIMDELSNPRRPFVYQKYSIFRQLFGKKDYIVNWGCRVIEYEIIK